MLGRCGRGGRGRSAAGRDGRFSRSGEPRDEAAQGVGLDVAVPSVARRLFAIDLRGLGAARPARARRSFQRADGVAAWGGEEAAREIRKLVPSSARLVEWGHKISFAYLAKDRLADDAVLEAAAREVCAFEQQACSSPQVLYLETADWPEVEAFAARFAPVLGR
ncbi:MAG TPA: acyl-CoA reductase, partial [Elusimicrobiota bacterium]|nr:acyl-CoA reductase [Elusimicrobiota bacterium]